MDAHTADLALPYTIAFCLVGEKVLMLQRNKEPWKSFWNGVGGKIEVGEEPCEAIKREILEETGLDINLAKSFDFVGIVTWSIDGRVDSHYGMYAYLVEFPKEVITWQTKQISEGILEWKQLGWVCNKQNPEIARNVPFFLPSMVERKDTRQYHCVFEKNQLIRLEEK